ncbi:MAG: NAAT family transporter [Lentisphaerae bacterium]|nr:NAAT family transporter [Lentisphaerota bacterium]
MVISIINNILKFLFLMTPFFVLSMFLAYTQGWTVKQKRKLSLRVGFSIFLVSLVLFYFGHWIFKVFDITIDAFRIGGGGLLFLSAVGLVNGKVEDKKPAEMEDDIVSERKISNIAVVPLAIPVTVGPGTTAALLVSGADAVTWSQKTYGTVSLFFAIVILTTMLFLGTKIEEKVGKNGIVILSKVTGLILAAMAAQMIFVGARAFWA